MKRNLSAVMHGPSAASQLCVHVLRCFPILIHVVLIVCPLWGSHGLENDSALHHTDPYTTPVDCVR